MKDYRYLKLIYMAWVPIFWVLGYFQIANPVHPDWARPEIALLLLPVLVVASVAQVALAPVVVSRLPTPKNRVMVPFGAYEGVAFYGLMLTYLSYDSRYVLSFGLVALGLMLSHRDRQA